MYFLNWFRAFLFILQLKYLNSQILVYEQVASDLFHCAFCNVKRIFCKCCISYQRHCNFPPKLNGWKQFCTILWVVWVQLEVLAWGPLWGEDLSSLTRDGTCTPCISCWGRSVWRGGLLLSQEDWDPPGLQAFTKCQGMHASGASILPRSWPPNAAT